MASRNEPILLNDFRRQWSVIGSEAQAALARVGNSGWYILGEEVAAFEKSLARYWPTSLAVGVANGLDALEIALRSLDIGPGNRVLTTPLTAFATTLAILRIGAIPVFVDVDDLGLLDLALCRKALEQDSSIRAIVPVHLYGFCLDLEELASLQSKFDVAIVEDCAQSIGASWGGRCCGTVGQAAATSFYPTKNLGALGDGGALLTADPQVAERARCIRNYGQREQYVHTEFGLNSRLDELQAAILNDALLPRLDGWTRQRCRIAEQYLARIHNQWIHLPTRSVITRSRMSPVWHLFPVLVEDSQRASFRNALREAGVTTGVHYPNLVSEQPILKGLAGDRSAADLPRAAEFARCEVSLPIHPFLTEEEVNRVVDACNRWHP